jgi:uncharacterized protein (DUF924 family)
MRFAKAAEVIAFWQQAGPERWFNKDAAFDGGIRARFLETHEAAATGRLDDWEMTAEGTLGLLILLDQFPRNMFRGSARSFATDALALGIARRAVARGFDHKVDHTMRGFFYLPFQHSEQLSDQERGVELYKGVNDPGGLKWAEIHADIIRRFGRFPHRNKVLGRATTAAEQKFLDEGGFAG